MINDRTMTPLQIDYNLDQARREMMMAFERINKIEAHYMQNTWHNRAKLPRIEQIIELLDAAMEETKRAIQ